MKSFQTFISENKAILKKLERERIATLAKLKNIQVSFLYLCIGYGVVLASLIAINSIFNGSILIGIVLFILLTLYNFYYVQKPREAIINTFTRAYKLEVIRSLVTFIDPAIKYYPSRQIHRYKFEASNLYLSKDDKYEGEDYFVGKVGKTKFELCELYVSRPRSRDYDQIIFQGIFLIADFNKNFHGSTYVIPQSDFEKKMLSNTVGVLFRDLKTVSLENPVFNTSFFVHSTDVVEARYILSTALVERILALKRKLRSNIRVSFYKSRLFLAMPTATDFFDPNLKTSLFENTSLERAYEEIMLCLEIIEDLNLNTRIWSK